MRIRRLPLDGAYTVYATCDGRGECTLLGFLQELDANLQKDRNRMLALLDKVATDGPPRNTDISHKIDHEIWEFIQGRLRVLWFYDQGKMVVCTHGFIKRTQRTPRGDIEFAKRVREQYFAAKQQGNLFVEEEANG